MIDYGFSKKLSLQFDEAVATVTKELNKEGFGILTEIDVKATFKRKLNVDFPRYHILGACNPPNAHKALLAEPDIGLMLPCNVIVYETDEGTAVSIVRPTAAMGMIDNPGLKKVAGIVEEKLEKVFEAL